MLNLGRTGVTRGQVEALLRRKPIAGLRELFIVEPRSSPDVEPRSSPDVEQHGAISRILPDPEQIAPAPQAR